MNRKLFGIIFISSALVLGGTIFSTALTTKKAISFNAAGCNHVGYHYTAKDPTDIECGWKEFWVCCKCHEAFLKEPSGTFTDHSASEMVGELTKEHIAYLSPLKGGENGDYYIVDPFDE